MAQRQEATAEEIQQAVQLAVNRLTDAAENAEIGIPPPQLTEDDGSGCNWDIPRFNGDRMYTEVVARVVRDAQTRYRLKVE